MSAGSLSLLLPLVVSLLFWTCTHAVQFHFPNPSTDAVFGSALAVYANRAVVCAPGYSSSTDHGGAAFMYKFDTTPYSNGARWNYTQVITPDDSAANDAFCSSAAMNTEWMVIGAPFKSDDARHSGAVYIYNIPYHGTWLQQKKLRPPSGTVTVEDRYGWAVSIHNGTLVVGADGADDGGNTNSGVAHVYRYVAGSPGTNGQMLGNWDYEVKLQAADSHAFLWFGWSLHITESAVAVGAILDNSVASANGAVYVFFRNATHIPSASSAQKIVGPNATAGDKFGFAVSLSSEWLAIGAPFHRTQVGNLRAGSVYLYSQLSYPVGQFSLKQTLYAPSESAKDDMRFGAALDIFDFKAVVGAPFWSVQRGAWFNYNLVADVWLNKESVIGTSNSPGVSLGHAVGINHNVTLVGSPYASDSTYTDRGEAKSYAVPFCGDGTTQSPEQCDDKNDIDGDGCSSLCVIENLWSCLGQPSECFLCGSGVLDGTEECDDGGNVDHDGCSSDCKIEAYYQCSGTNPSACFKCGNGRFEGLVEQCDDGNRDGGDGCSSMCVIEPKWDCYSVNATFNGTSTMTNHSICQLCGNGKLEGTEICDDGNLFNGDGCSEGCEIESGWNCASTPKEISICARVAVPVATAAPPAEKAWYEVT